MRILCQTTRRSSIAEGWGRTLQSAEHEFTLWDPAGKPAFDVFDETSPHLFIETQPRTRATHKCVEERKLPVVQQFDPPSAADTFLFAAGDARDEVACDFAFIGTYRPDKQRLLNDYILPLSDLGSLKIFGTGDWPTPYYLGQIGDEIARAVYTSARVNLNVSTLGRVSDRVYNALLAGGICVSNYIDTKADVPGDIVLRGLTPYEFRQHASFLLSLKLRRWRDELKRRSREFVLRSNTYWHRAADILHSASFDREAEKLVEVYRETVRI